MDDRKNSKQAGIRQENQDMSLVHWFFSSGSVQSLSLSVSPFFMAA